MIQKSHYPITQKTFYAVYFVIFKLDVNSMTAYVKQMKNVIRCHNICIYSMGNQSFEIRLDLFDEIKYYYVFLWHFGTSY